MMLRACSLSLFLGVAASAATTPTFTKDVLPILQRNCQGCHRPGEAAPMSFMSYKDSRPWAKAIKGAVLTEEDAAMACRSALRPVHERKKAQRGGDSNPGLVGRCWSAGREPEECAQTGGMGRRLEHPHA